MVWFETWLIRGLLGLMWVLPVWMDNDKDRCKALDTIKDQFNSTLRRRYLKHNFPINYTIQVPYEEVFRLRNISRLRNESVEVTDLQELWLKVAMLDIKRILSVLPEKHVTRRRYLTQLENLFKTFQQSFMANSKPEDDLPESLYDIYSRISNGNYQGRRSVTPKSLLDNCYRTMHCLFEKCFSRDEEQHDYCTIDHWRTRKGTTPQPT